MIQVHVRIVKYLISITIFSILPIYLSNAVASNLADDQHKSTLVIAKVGDNPKKVYPQLTGIAEYLANRLKDQGITHSEVLVAENNQIMASWLRSSKVDLVTETPFSAMYLQEQSSAKPVAISWRKGKPFYHSVIFVRADSSINSIKDLLGKVIAFEDEGSTSAYFLPASTLLQRGYAMARLGSVRETVTKGEINYIFSREEINSTTWVHKGLVDAAALSNLDWNSEDAVPLAMKKDLKIIFETNRVPRTVELVSAKREPEFISRLQYELLNAHTNEQGKESLYKYKKTSRLTKIDEETQTVLDKISMLMKQVKTELEL